jgi:hypothetical protein
MLFNIEDLQINILKKFDGINNYFNPSHFNGKTICRKETIYQEKFLINDVIDINGDVILKNKIDDDYFWCYEDARFVSENEIMVSCCKRDKINPLIVINVEQKKYNLSTKSFINYKTQNSYFEKNWQIYNKNIIYHVNPFTIFTSNEEMMYKKQINWNPWIKRYGPPGLSSNIFDVGDERCILFHSYKSINGINLRYYIGLLRLSKSLIPISYTSNSIFPSFEDYDRETFMNYFNWKRKLETCPTIVDVIFPMNIVVDKNYINIYCGINDCICANVKIDKNTFLEKIKNSDYIII